jgi:hypothetical protein
MCTCSSDYGSSEFYDVSYPKARKEYRCYECRTIIPPGTLYARHAQKVRCTRRSSAWTATRGARR